MGADAKTAAPATTGPEADTLAWDKSGGLLPAVVQDADSLRVLMLGYMDRAALAATRESGQVTFYSRSRQRLWRKGETSGHVLQVVSVQEDCDRDTLLVLARPQGPTCHLGRASCFADAPAAVPAQGNAQATEPAPSSPAVADARFLAALDALVARRHAERPAGSYTTRLFDAGLRRIAQKVGEEGVETALAAVAQDDAELLGESADLVFHLLVLLRARGLGLSEVVATLRERHPPAPPEC